MYCDGGLDKGPVLILGVKAAFIQKNRLALKLIPKKNQREPDALLIFALNMNIINIMRIKNAIMFQRERMFRDDELYEVSK